MWKLKFLWNPKFLISTIALHMFLSTNTSPLGGGNVNGCGARGAHPPPTCMSDNNHYSHYCIQQLKRLGACCFLFSERSGLKVEAFNNFYTAAIQIEPTLDLHWGGGGRGGLSQLAGMAKSQHPGRGCFHLVGEVVSYIWALNDELADFFFLKLVDSCFCVL